MPTYDYKCEACGHAFEKFHSMSAAPIRKCPKCGKRKVKRLVGTGAGMIFKGSGFYITDYRSENYKSAAKADGGSAASPTKSTESAPAAAKESKGESKAESKPTTKSEAKPEPKPAAKSSSAKR